MAAQVKRTHERGGRLEEKISKGRNKNIMLFREKLDDIRKDNQKIVRRKKIYYKVFLIGMTVLYEFWE